MTDAELDALVAEAAADRLAIEAALRAGARRFPCRWGSGFAFVHPSARPDCPAGHVQVTRFDDEGPIGHTYADPDPAETARELDALGYTAEGCTP